MPELPEVETINRQLSQKIVGKKIKEINVLRKKNFKGNKVKVIGKKITGVRRQAKIVIIDLNSQFHLIVHLKMTGQLIFRQKIETEPPFVHKPKGNPYNVDLLPNKYTRVIIKFDDNSYLLFNNLRAFGWIKVVTDEILKKELENFSGVNPLSKKFTVDYLKEITKQTNRSIKLLIMDQSKIGGIGNIYASEALFCARIHPKTESKKIAQYSEKLNKLHNCIIKVLKEALKYKGSTANDDAFRDTSGKRGKMQHRLKVYGKEGEKCPHCKGKIKRIKISGRSTFFCPSCQPKL